MNSGYWANLLRHFYSALASGLRPSARNATFSVASNAQRAIVSALASGLRPSARNATYASRCWLPRAWPFELRDAAPRRGLGGSGSQLGPVLQLPLQAHRSRT